jgi:N-acetylneuraminate synthase
VQFHLPEPPYAASRSLPLVKTLEYISKNNGLPIVLLNNDGSLYGVVSSGDIAIHLARNSEIALSKISAQDVANKTPIIGHIQDSVETVEGYFSPSIRALPVIDSSRLVVRVVTDQQPYIEIGAHRVCTSKPPFLIAEIGVNHNGDINEAYYLIEAAAKAGCHAVKFQHRSLNLYNLDYINSYDLGTQYIIAEIERTRLSISELSDSCNLARDLSLEAIVTPFDEIALREILESECNPSALKIASCDMTNRGLIKACAATDKPLLLSTGMSYEREIRSASQYLQALMVEHAFLHCNSTYPSPPQDSNLSYIPRLKEITRTIVGYSSHDGNPIIPISAIACGASILEFHITRSREAKGTDHKASIEIGDLPKFVGNCSLVYESLGLPNPRTPSQGELANRQSLGKSLALREDKPSGYCVTANDFHLISPGSGLASDQITQILGKELKQDTAANKLLKTSDFVNEEDQLFTEDLSPIISGLIAKGYIPGIPVRYHDVKIMQQIFNVPMLEFHMSDRDLALNPADYVDLSYEKTHLIVHAVEQYEDGFILDLASDDPKILDRSFNEITRLCIHVDKLRQYFLPCEKVQVVLNLGGFTQDDFLSLAEYEETLRRASISIKKISLEHQTYTFLPQTMPPFPWHQGGRSFHNLLTSRQRVADFLKATTTNICFDVSHTALSCAYFNESIEDHLTAMEGRISHIHLSDAQGVNAEGLEVGEGSIDFRSLHEYISKSETNLFLIPEIWQGHLDHGHKFYSSLVRFYEQISH